ncbi:MAG TPA: cell division protein ZapA [Aestuariivirgaceae bacterium]|jgi:cell division protein ZapA|nr:cell division protein ZapA [Aestuariivirgaceae bacterium]
MAQVVIEVNGRPYTMQCNDGEEEHLASLALMLDEEVARIRDAVGNVGDIRLLMMAGLVISDRLVEARREMEGLRDHIRRLGDQRGPSVGARIQEDKVAQRLDAAARRLEQLARETRGRGQA